MGRGEVQVQARPPRNPGPHLRVLVRGVVVAHKVNVEALGGLPVDQPQKREPLPDGGAAACSARAPCPWPRRGRRTASSCRVGRSRACSLRHSRGPVAGPAGCGPEPVIRVFSSTQSTTACSGGLRYSPVISRTFSMKKGSLDSLSVSARCGLTPNSANQRCTVLLETPSASAIRRTLQVPERAGLACRARLITAATFSSS